MTLLPADYKAQAFSTLKAKVQQEWHVGQWFSITQELIDRFASATLDEQWIHTQPEKAKRYSPFGNTVAHGFLSLSLIPYLTESVDPEKARFAGVKMGVNYGLNRVRFPAPVLVGASVRARSNVLSVSDIAENALQYISEVTIEVQGQEKPACVAELIARLYF